MGKQEFVRIAFEACKFNYTDDRMSMFDFFVKGRRSEFKNLRVPVLIINDDKEYD